MTEKFKDHYRIPSARLQNWDYARFAAYFITICTAGREHYFGSIGNPNGEMILSELGAIVETEWLKTLEIRPDMNLILGKYMVMPDHFHSIIIIGPNEYNDSPINGTNSRNKFGPQYKNLASIVRGFKSAISTYATTNNIQFGWQKRFYDRIIRNDYEFLRISNYIETNPENWHG